MRERIIVNVDYSNLPDGAKALYGAYDLIAASIGVNPDDVQSYDCRFMDASRNGQDTIYEKAAVEVKETAQITMALAVSGMKVDDSLPPNTVAIYRRGMILKDGNAVLDVYSGKELSLFLSGDCIIGSKRDNYHKRILVLKPERLKDEYRDSKYQLWLPYADTFGCDPNNRGKAIYAVCLYDGEISTVNWRRDDFLGILRPDRIPPFVSEKGYYDMFMGDRSFKDSVDKTVDLFPQQQQHMKGAHAHER